MIIELTLTGVLHKKGTISFHNNVLLKNDEIPIMDSLLILILWLFHLMGMIITNNIQCHNFSYVK